MINLGLKISSRGPLFDQATDRAVKAGLADAQRAVARQGVTEVRQQLSRVLKHPTGNYSRHIAERRRGAVDVVHDSGVVYGPWLAGTGRRNRASRFKGYRHWRRAVQAMRRKAGAIASRVIADRLRRS